MESVRPWQVHRDHRQQNGLILRDEAYKAGARITLERGGDTPFAITCGIYGAMVHTVFASSEEEASTKYEAMKQRLELLMAETDDEIFLQRISSFDAEF